MWDLLCKLVTNELYFARFQRDHRARMVTIRHNDVQNELSSEDNVLWKFVRAPETPGRAWAIIGLFTWTCLMTRLETGSITLDRDLVSEMTTLLEAGLVEVEIDERSI